MIYQKENEPIDGIEFVDKEIYNKTKKEVSDYEKTIFIPKHQLYSEGLAKLNERANYESLGSISKNMVIQHDNKTVKKQLNEDDEEE